MMELRTANARKIKTLIILASYHHHNTEKVARVMAEVLDAAIKSPKDVRLNELQEYDLIGFGSGIYHGRNHKALLELADHLPPGSDQKAFIFSTNGAPASVYGSARYHLQKEYLKMVAENHGPLRKMLQTKGFQVLDEFSCAGFNTNSFLKLFGGINKGRPNGDDLEHAKECARELRDRVSRLE